jgi:hypothetical protein
MRRWWNGGCLVVSLWWRRLSHAYIGLQSLVPLLGSSCCNTIQETHAADKGETRCHGRLRPVPGQEVPVCCLVTSSVGQLGSVSDGHPSLAASILWGCIWSYYFLKSCTTYCVTTFIYGIPDQALFGTLVPSNARAFTWVLSRNHATAQRGLCQRKPALQQRLQHR